MDKEGGDKRREGNILAINWSVAGCMQITNANEPYIAASKIANSSNDIPIHWPTNSEASQFDMLASVNEEETTNNTTCATNLSSLEEQHTTTTEPISLAVSADITQAPISINGQTSNYQGKDHATGDAVAQHLKGLLSHISVSTTSLKSELVGEVNSSTVHASNKDIANGSTMKGSAKVNGNSVAQAVSHTVDSEHDGLGTLPPPKDNLFKRIIHAIDNHINPPSKLIPHLPHYRHSNRLDNSSTSPPGSPTSHTTQHSTRRIPTFASSITSNFHKHKHGSTSPKQSHSKSFFPFIFHSANNSSSTSAQQQQQQAQTKERENRFKGPLLYGTSDINQHDAVIATALHVCNLYNDGFDVTKHIHNENESSSNVVNGNDVSESEDKLYSQSVDECNTKKEEANEYDHRARHALSSSGFEFRLIKCEKCQMNKEASIAEEDDNTCQEMRCFDCITRLYHTPSNTAVTGDNRRTYIADGVMYDAVSNLVQSAAQEIMAETFDLVWITLCDGKGGGGIAQQQQDPQSTTNSRSNSTKDWPRDENGDIIVKEPIRALVSRQRQQQQEEDTPEYQPQETFLIATGKGKVRAGIFSRHHLLTTGLEPSTAFPLIYEAKNRGMNCVIIDPNARGDIVGMDTFKVSIRGLFEEQHSASKEDNKVPTSTNHETRAILPSNIDSPIYILAHSAAGGQLVRYLLDQQKDAPLLSQIRCLAFTDSTHSIQWLKKHPHISSLIQSSNAVYVRSSNKMRDDDWETVSAGDVCPKDHFWSHRFGEIRTVWAGTTEHSLTNWTAHKAIWDHVDSVRESESQRHERM